MLLFRTFSFSPPKLRSPLRFFHPLMIVGDREISQSLQIPALYRPVFEVKETSTSVLIRTTARTPSPNTTSQFQEKHG
ncbi:hypothetical protein Cob_v004190 [Colletotrichum orbiculare MAFF 240422]|uniref:Uncharacterized protein n=1 Tax=Colletotrichum orbiculare (strain 104-T / ATCC 96160 / CBS 514.97 / LARS 414 / MAFF 240422) TaxID=1213857 RepID=A0A484FXT3_COLOR|nr:hypothetical protein Cob_v004190 [Colletotrichum orbiculare MAFF 240422]